MNSHLWIAPLAAMAWLLVPLLPAAPAPVDSNREIPDSLKSWAGWALWDVRDLDSPAPYHDPKQALRLWPSRLALQVDGAGGRFGFGVTVFSGTWVTLPGDGELWPIEVTANGAVVPVVEHEGRPAVKLVADILSEADKFFENIEAACEEIQQNARRDIFGGGEGGGSPPAWSRDRSRGPGRQDRGVWWKSWLPGHQDRQV